MAPEEIKARILELAKPLDDFMREQGIASFLVGDNTETVIGTFEVSAGRVPLPPRIKCTLARYGSIYMIDEEVGRA